MWPWFHQFMGGIRFKNYIATFVTGEVTIEDKKHPAMKGITSPFVIKDEEWYTYDTSPRPNVHVLASVDEKTYTPATDLKDGRPSGDLDQRAREGQEHLHVQLGHRRRISTTNPSRRFCQFHFLGPLAGGRIAQK